MKKQAIVEKGYTKEFYDNIALNRSSAKTIVPIILDFYDKWLKSKQANGKVSVIDFGCGTAQWLSVYKEQGCIVKGLDGDGVSVDQLLIDESEFEVHDLKKKYIVEAKYSIAQCVEVAEHIEEEYADTLINSLTDASDFIVFSGAIPYQRGVHHVNCQWQTYWIKKFNERGYKEIDFIRKKVWKDPEVQHFYAQNMFLFVKNADEDILRIAESVNEECLYDLVHPRMWESLCEAKIIKKIYSIYYKHHWVYELYDKLFNRT